MVTSSTRSINILVLGQTQAGKSSLIRKLQRLSVTKEDHEAKIGDLGLSMTTQVKMYPLKLPYTDWQLIESKTGKEVKIPHDEDAILKKKGLAKRKDLLVEAVSPEPEYIHINLIDTPGLSDSDGRDAQHICNVLETLDRNSKSENPALRTISAIFLVLMSTSAFSSNAKEIFKYYERCMPNLFRGAAIINTNFTVKDWRVDYQTAQERNEGSILPIAHTRLKKMQARCDALETDPYFKDGGPSQHFFIDSNPIETFPFEEYTTRTQVTDILRFVKYQPSMPIKEMWLCKMADWLAVDQMLIEWLRTARQLFEASEKSILGKTSNEEIMYANTIKMLNKTNSDIASIEQKLAMLDVDTEYTLRSENTVAKTFLEVAGSAMVFRGARDSLTITESRVSHFHVTAPDNDTGTWTSRGQSPTSGTWTGQYQGKWRKAPKLTARAWTTTRDYHAAEIAERKEELQKLITQRDDCMFNAEYSKPDNAPQSREEALKLGRFVGACDNIIKKLNADKLPLNDKFNALAMRRYQRRRYNDKPSVTRDDLYRIAYLEDEELPYALTAYANIVCVNSVVAAEEKSFWDEIEELPRKSDKKVKKEDEREKRPQSSDSTAHNGRPNTQSTTATNPQNQSGHTMLETQTPHAQNNHVMREGDSRVQENVANESWLHTQVPQNDTSPPLYHEIPPVSTIALRPATREQSPEAPIEREARPLSPQPDKPCVAEVRYVEREEEKTAKCCVIL